jgi:hypothetical protein
MLVVLGFLLSTARVPATGMARVTPLFRTWDFV